MQFVSKNRVCARAQRKSHCLPTSPLSLHRGAAQRAYIRRHCKYGSTVFRPAWPSSRIPGSSGSSSRATSNTVENDQSKTATNSGAALRKRQVVIREACRPHKSYTNLVYYRIKPVPDFSDPSSAVRTASIDQL